MHSRSSAGAESRRRETALDYFEEFLRGTDAGPQLQCFIDEGTATTAQYEAFMKLAGPYWMSCVTKNQAVPILSPDHYRTYLERRAQP